MKTVFLPSLFCVVQVISVASKAVTQNEGAVSSVGSQPRLQSTVPEPTKEPPAPFSQVGPRAGVLVVQEPGS